MNAMENISDQDVKVEDLLKKGLVLCSEDRYVEAVEHFREASESGNMRANLYLALFYYEGKGVEKDLERAAQCLRTVVKSGGELGREAKQRLRNLADIDSGNGIGIVGTYIKDWVNRFGSRYGCSHFEELKSQYDLAKRGNQNAQKQVVEILFNYMSDNDCPESDGETLMRYLRNMAEHDDAEAQYKLAIMYGYHHVGVGLGAKDANAALEWCRKAIQGGSLNARVLLGNSFFEGEFAGNPFEQDKEEAFKLYLNAAEQGDLDAQEAIGSLYDSGFKGKWSKEEAVLLLKKLGLQGNADAWSFIDDNVDFDFDDEFLKWLKNSAKKGCADAQSRLGSYYMSFNNEFSLYSIKSATSAGIRWYKKAAEQGHPAALHALCFCYYNGVGVKQDYEEALKWCLKAAEQDDDLAMCYLGEMYYHGRGTEKNNDEAFRWCCKAELGKDAERYLNDRLFTCIKPLKNNITFGPKLLDEMYWNGDVPRQYFGKEYKRYMRNVNNSISACFRLGAMCHYGMGVEKSETSALRWYRKTFKGGSGSLDCIMADMCYEGKGINQNRDEAIKWYKKAANKGDRNAQTKLIELWYEADPVKPDFKTVFKWLKKHAELWEKVSAQYKLGVLYLEGKYVKQDKNKAISWLKMAAKQGYKPAKKRLAKLGE